MSTVGFLHTSPVHVSTFEALVAELAPDTTVVTVVSEELLARARASGVDEQVVAGTGRAIDELVAGGAEVVVCTCSTLGGAAESIGRQRGQSVVRVDRPMAERAVELGGRIVVVAALESTLAPTRELLESVAAERAVDLELEMRVVAEAWALFEAGDQDGYLGAIADTLTALAGDCDVIVLAQASMAGAASLFGGDTPVLSSPRLAVMTLVTEGVGRPQRSSKWSAAG